MRTIVDSVSTAPAIPEPTALIQSPDALCSAVERWADSSTSIDELNDAKARFAAIETYLGETSKVGRARVAATMRRLEVRIGQIIGEAKVGAHSSAIEGADLTKDERHDFRAMADDPDTVEAVIAESTDEKPASRRKVTQAVKANKPNRARPPRNEPSQVTDEEREEARLESELEEQVQRLRTAVEMLAYQLPNPTTFAAAIPDRVAHRFDMHLAAAHAWLGEFTTAWDTTR